MAHLSYFVSDCEDRLTRCNKTRPSTFRLGDLSLFDGIAKLFSSNSKSNQGSRSDVHNYEELEQQLGNSGKVVMDARRYNPKMENSGSGLFGGSVTSFPSYKGFKQDHHNDVHVPKEFEIPVTNIKSSRGHYGREVRLGQICNWYSYIPEI